jgi:hypothetical protein
MTHIELLFCDTWLEECNMCCGPLHTVPSPRGAASRCSATESERDSARLNLSLFLCIISETTSISISWPGRSGAVIKRRCNIGGLWCVATMIRLYSNFFLSLFNLKKIMFVYADYVLPMPTTCLMKLQASCSHVLFHTLSIFMLSKDGESKLNCLVNYLAKWLAILLLCTMPLILIGTKLYTCLTLLSAKARRSWS